MLSINAIGALGVLATKNALAKKLGPGADLDAMFRDYEPYNFQQGRWTPNRDNLARRLGADYGWGKAEVGQISPQQVEGRIR